jgi:(5-formylfuran-3-yl)methyl phosphate synthase
MIQGFDLAACAQTESLASRDQTSIAQLLISVRSAREAALALEGGADIIDVKEPRHGVLGAAPLDVIRAIVETVDGRRPVSATVGDVPFRDAVEAARAVAATGVDFVKIGAFDVVAGAGLDLGPFAPSITAGNRLILVMFADRTPDFAIIPRLGAAGFRGVMLDTAGKNGGGLTTHLDAADLSRFLGLARGAGLFAGLAGSLRATDIAPLLALKPDVLGFRGAACKACARQEELDLSALSALRRLIPQEGQGTGADKEHEKISAGGARSG